MEERLNSRNLDDQVVSDFGKEWVRFNQAAMPKHELEVRGHEYFCIFPWDMLPENPEGFDMGCGTGRWAHLVAHRVGKLHCIDPSEAIAVAKQNLREFHNVVFHNTSLDNVSLAPSSQDFGFSLGVLHHVPDTLEAIKSCIKLLKPGAPLLLYLYYAFDNRPVWFRFLWRLSDIGRRFICRMPKQLKCFFTDIIACFVYWPLARLSYLIDCMGFDVKWIPLSYYMNYSFYSMRTDSLDRFGTRLEKRFTRKQIQKLMIDAGMEKISFSDGVPYWVVLGHKIQNNDG